MNSERQKMLAGELLRPARSGAVAARERARDLCQALNATREAQQDERRRILRELFGRGGDTVWMQPPFFCDYGIEHRARRAGVLQLQLRRARRVPGAHRRASRCSARRCRSTRPMHPFNAELRRRAGVRQAGRDRLGRLGRRRGDHPAWRPDRLARGDRRRQRRHARRSRGRVRRRQSVPGDSRDHGIGGRTLRPLCPAWRPARTEAPRPPPLICCSVCRRVTTRLDARSGPDPRSP